RGSSRSPLDPNHVTSYVIGYTMSRARAGSTLHTYGGLLLGSRLRRISDMLYAGVDEIYRSYGVRIPSRTVPLLMIMRDHPQSLTIGEPAERAGLSHVAVSKEVTALARALLIGDAMHPRDGRRVVLHFLPKGKELLERLEPVWRAIVAAVDEIDAKANV